MNFGAFLSIKDHVFPSNSPQIFPMKQVTTNPPWNSLQNEGGWLGPFRNLRAYAQNPGVDAQEGAVGFGCFRGPW